MSNRLVCSACSQTLRRYRVPYPGHLPRHAAIRIRRLATSTSSSIEMGLQVTDPVLLYEQLVRSGRVQYDEEQFRLLVQLRRLHSTLVDYRPSTSLRYLLESSNYGNRASSSSRSDSSEDGPPPVVLANLENSKALVRALTHEDDLSNLESPTGFLLTGSVGTGKTMLLDLFYQSLPIKKQRIHYHAFLLGLYRKVFLALEQQRVTLEGEEQDMQRMARAGTDGQGYPWSRREENKAKALTKGWRQVFAGGRKFDDPSLVKEYVLANIALDMIRDATVLAFDEVQLVDIAGAGILRRVLTWYWRLGGVVIATSNRLPSDLYQQGVQREQFRAFLGHLAERCPIYELRSENDWRRRERTTSSDFFSMQEEDYPAWSRNFEGKTTWLTDKGAFEDCLEIVQGEGKPEPKDITVYGRKLKVPWQVEGEVAKFTFAELCEKALGPADYLTLTSSYSTLVVTGIPQLKLSAKNEARRFITFLDAAYESKTRLICLAASEPDNIFFPDAADALANEDNPLTQEMIGEVMQDLEAPFRPNISSYTSTQIQDTLASAVAETKEQAAKGDVKQQHKMDQPAFKTLAIFTGQDEQFAYKRALSRIYEITSLEFVKNAKHAPIPLQDRVWEHSHIPPTYHSRAPSSSPFSAPSAPLQVESETEETGELSYTAQKYPRGTKVDPSDPQLDVSQLPKPKIGQNHFWGIVDSWGKKAGRWGLGPKQYAQAEAAEEDKKAQR